MSFHPHKLLLRAREGHDIRIVSSRLGITPAHRTQWHWDALGNSVAIVEFHESASLLEFESEVVIEHYEDEPLRFELEPYAASFPFQYDPDERPVLVPYLQPLFTKDNGVIRSWVREFWTPASTPATFEMLGSMNRAVSERLQYVRREEPGVHSPSRTLSEGTGSCRDFATLFMEACRHLGLAARFVSGYLYAPNLPAAEGATHAWAEVYLPGAGWRGFDSTTGQLVGGDHIAVAVARNPESIPRVSGAYEGDQPPNMTVEVEVVKI